VRCDEDESPGGESLIDGRGFLGAEEVLVSTRRASRVSREYMALKPETRPIVCRTLFERGFCRSLLRWW
jgi:hypothetical protein